MQGTRRKSVFAEAYDPEADDDDDGATAVFPKTDEQRARLVESVKNVLLFRSLDKEQVSSPRPHKSYKSRSRSRSPGSTHHASAFNPNKCLPAVSFFGEIIPHGGLLLPASWFPLPGLPFVIDLFSQMNQVLDAMFERKVQPADYIIRQGDDGDNFYVIES